VPPKTNDGKRCATRGLQKKCKTNSDEFERFYKDVEHVLGKIPDRLLTTYGKDYIWKDEHMITYIEMLRKGFKHDLKPTHEELLGYKWYSGLSPEDQKYFKSKGDPSLKEIIREEIQAVLRERNRKC
jgi:hypothetical protein